jgi:hypothetical protein
VSVDGDSVKLAISLLAIMMSAGSLLFAWRAWIQSNRPIVTAFVAEHGIGNTASTFDLVIANSGNRPAVGVRLFALKSDIRQLLDDGAPEKRHEWMELIFSEESLVPLLRNGEELRTSFGAYIPSDENKKWLNYGAQIPVRVEYSDLDGRKFVSKLPLRIYARHGFGGASWTPSP